MRRYAVALILLAFASEAYARSFVDAGHTIAVDPQRGVDRRVDYASLLAYGPWDDRNYRLTKADLALLAPNEAEQVDPIPAFFRVGMRRAWPELRRSGPGEYPRHAYPTFRKMFGGYLVNGLIYPDVKKVGTRFEVVLENGVAPGAPATDALSGEVRVTTPNGGAESAVKINPVDPSKVIAATNGPIAGQTMEYSTDGGTSWTETTLPLGNTNGDPSVDWSSDGTYAYTTTLGSCNFNGCKVWFYRSNDGGATWTGLESDTPNDPRRELTNSGSDKEYLHVDKYPGSPYKDNVYLTWHNGNVMQFAVSTDFGNTFTKQAFSSASAELGIGSDIATGRNGEIYYIWPGINSKTIRLKKSTDGGVTFGSSIVVATTQASFIFPIPAIETREAFVYVSTAVDLSDGPYAGSVYAAWTDSTAPTTSNPSSNHARIQVAHSRDGGATWSVTTPHETADASTVDRFHPWLAVGPDGTVHVVFYDTRRSANRTGVDFFYAYSTDGGVTWSAPTRVTSVLSPNITDSFEFGDYNGADIVLDQLIGIWTDNRDESGGTAQSVDVYAAGIPPGSGGSASAAGYVPDGKFVPGVPLHVDKSGTDIALSWSPACGTVTDYAVYEGQLGVPNSLVSRLCSTGGATSAALTPSAGDRYYLAVPINGTVEGSYGQASDGSQRAPAAAGCFPQSIVSSCP